MRTKTKTMIMLVVCALVAVMGITGCKTSDAIKRRLDSKAADVIAPATPDAVQPETEPVVEPVADSGFRYVPFADHIEITIPERLPHHQLYIVTLNTHMPLYGPDGSGRGASGDVVYKIGGSGAEWAAKAMAACPRGYPSLMVFLKLNEIDPRTGYNNAGWRVKDPSQSYGGDYSIMLDKGQDH